MPPNTSNDAVGIITRNDLAEFIVRSEPSISHAGSTSKAKGLDNKHVPSTFANEALCGKNSASDFDCISSEEYWCWDANVPKSEERDNYWNWDADSTHDGMTVSKQEELSRRREIALARVHNKIMQRNRDRFFSGEEAQKRLVRESIDRLKLLRDNESKYWDWESEEPVKIRVDKQSVWSAREVCSEQNLFNIRDLECRLIRDAKIRLEEATRKESESNLNYWDMRQSNLREGCEL